MVCSMNGYKFNSTLRVSEVKLKRGGRLKAGRRMNDWRRAWRFLKPRLEAAGRVHCEFSFIEHDCIGILDPCHSKKWLLMEGNDIYAVAMGCRRVHELLDERMNHEEMEAAVMRAINEHGGLILPNVDD